MKRYIFAACAALALAACTPQAQQTALTDVATAQAAVADAISSYQIAKGIAQVAVASDPKLSAQLGQQMAKADKIVDEAQLAAAATGTAAPALIQLAGKIGAAAQQITQTAAPAIKVVPNG